MSTCIYIDHNSNEAYKPRATPDSSTALAGAGRTEVDRAGKAGKAGGAGRAGGAGCVGEKAGE